MRIQRNHTSFKRALSIGAAMLALSVTGCAQNLTYAPSTVNENPIQVQQDSFIDHIAVQDLNEGYIIGVAQHYTRNGNSPLEVVVTYDPKDEHNTAMHATSEVSAIVQTLRDHGVRNISSSVMPVKDQGANAQLVVAYTALSAHAPKGCGLMPGLNGEEFRATAGYKMGCSVDTMIAKQIARPGDLLGNDTLPATSNGRAASNIALGGQSGVQNDSIGGESASDSN